MLGIFPPAFDSSVSFVCSVDFSQFEPISFLYIQEIVFLYSVPEMFQ